MFKYINGDKHVIDNFGWEKENRYWCIFILFNINVIKNNIIHMDIIILFR